MRTVRRTAVLTGLAAVTALVVVPGGVAQAGPPRPSATATITTYISGLNTPRGITFDAKGRLYVAQSGKAGAGAFGMTRSGKVTRYKKGSKTPAWTRSFESIYAAIDPSQPADVLGPEGLSALRTKGCKQDWTRDCAVRLILSLSQDGVAALSKGAVSAKDAGHLYRLSRKTGRKTDLSNVGNQMYKWTGDRKSLFPDDFPDSNPFGVLVTELNGKVRTFVADAGANTISEIKANGKARVIAYIPNEKGGAKRDSTPTCIAAGPDGKLYVATLNLLSNFAAPSGGQSDVWRVNPNAKYPTRPKKWATGLTTPTGCIFGQDGNFWATEMFQPNSAGPPGDLVRVSFKRPSRLTRFGGGQLPLPGMLTQGPGGALFVTTNSASPQPGAGAVMKVTIS